MRVYFTLQYGGDGWICGTFNRFLVRIFHQGAKPEGVVELRTSCCFGNRLDPKGDNDDNGGPTLARTYRSNLQATT